MERTSLFGPTIKKVSEILKIDQLYPVDQKDADKLTDLLTQCFAEDPLYCQLIPQKQCENDFCRDFFSVIWTNCFKPAMYTPTVRR